jgi:Domain of unknown function (DUF4185)
MVLMALAAAPPQIDPGFFPYVGGWIGADAAYSIPLDKSSTIWLFGDTFVGKQRESGTMIRNSIAIRQCGNSNCRTTYWWSGMGRGHPSSFFKTPETDYYWPLDGFVHAQKLYIFLEQMRALPEGGAFGFDYGQIVLATVSNPRAKPNAWQVSYQTISMGNLVVPGIAAVIPTNQPNTKYVSVFTLFRPSKAKQFCGLLRIPLSDLANAGVSANWQYLAAGSRWLSWRRSTSPPDALPLLEGNIAEMSVAFRSATAQWIAVYPTPGFFSNTASYSVSSHLTGPWTVSSPLFNYPEMQKVDARYTPHVFCYAAKEHPELETAREMAVSYACNSTEEGEVLKDRRLYHPILVRRPFPVR